MSAKKIKYTAYVVERRIVEPGGMLGDRAGFKVGFQPEAAEGDPGETILMGGQFIETTDKEFFKQGIRYEVEVTIRRVA